MFDPVQALQTQDFLWSGGNGEVKAICPFHSDKKVGSFYFNTIKGTYKCFACGASGNIHSLVAQTSGTILEVPDIKPTKRFITTEWRNFINAPLALNNAYLQSRNITNESIEYFSIRESENGILFPLYDLDKEQLIGFQERVYIPNPLRYVIHGDKPEFFATLPYELLPERIYWVEGIFGVINAYQHGISACATMGASAYNSRIVSLLTNLDTVIIFDDDEAGYLNCYKIVSMSNGQIRAVVPGAETDEINQGGWDRITSTQPTNDLSIIYPYIKNKVQIELLK